MRVTIILLFLVSLIIGCEKEEEEKDPFRSCRRLMESLEGTYNITVISYPRQQSQEGTVIDILVFLDLNKCFDAKNGDVDRILFNNLFEFYGCSSHVLIENSSFIVTYEDDEQWAGAPLKGEGNIENGSFHFEGTIFTSAGEFPIVLDGIKTSQERRTDAC